MYVTKLTLGIPLTLLDGFNLVPMFLTSMWLSINVLFWLLKCMLTELLCLPANGGDMLDSFKPEPNDE